jgi:hypothetical protein
MSLGGFGLSVGVLWLGASAALVGCGDCSDESAAASKFLAAPVNLACQSDEDCVVVSVGCAEVARSTCGSAQLTREAAESSKWKELSKDIEDCESGGCPVCGALLVASCAADGFCGGAP